ncbi:hypothetical protein DY000_02060437 [Brassica cretica]|uniref:Uncharacterized protein n=1 Tax=Brassica cretica TaxID=69181 RepID=A0ABQ7B121_BRACR|nr:hypothetical protein DY000_02060437 [Brassica cretica]
MLRDEEGRTRNNTGQLINADGAVIPDDLNVNRRHDLNVDRHHDLNVDRHHDLNVDRCYNLIIDRRCRQRSHYGRLLSAGGMT